MKDSWYQRLLLMTVPLLLSAAVAEIGARLVFRASQGHSYAEHPAFLPHPELVYQNNPRYYVFHDRPAERFDFFFIPPLAAEDHRPRIWILGGSTSAAEPDGSDWPAALQRELPAFRIVNMGHQGYGTGQVQWLYEHYRDTIQPALVVVHDGWNYRGIRSSRLGFQPSNAPRRTDGWSHRASAALLNRSAAYGWAYRAYHKRHLESRCGSTDPYPEMREWEDDLRRTLKEMAARDRVLLALFPGLAMRDDVEPRLTPSEACVAGHFSFYREEYEARLAVLRHVAYELRLPTIDARTPYLEMAPTEEAALFRDYCHQTEEGNRLMAHAIHVDLQRQGFVPM
jgi:hypothetical protein